MGDKIVNTILVKQGNFGEPKQSTHLPSIQSWGDFCFLHK